VGVGGEEVGEEEVADLEKLGDGFAVIAGDTGSEILRSLDAAGSGFDGKAGDGDGSTGAARVGVEDLIVNNDGLRGIGSERRRRARDYGDGLKDGGKLRESEGEGFLFGGDESEIDGNGEKGRKAGGEMVGAGEEMVEDEMTLGVGEGFGDSGGGGGVMECEMGVGGGNAGRIEDGAGELSLEFGREEKEAKEGEEAKEVKEGGGSRIGHGQ